MGFYDVSAKYTIGTYSAIVRTLGPRKSTLGPTQRLHVVVKQRVLLFNAKPRLLVGHFISCIGARVTAVRLAGRLVKLERFAHDQNMISAFEWIAVDGHWVKIGVGIMATCLAGRAAVVVPNGEV